MDRLLEAAVIVVDSWEWCAQYQQTLYNSLLVGKSQIVDGLTDRELLEIAMRTDSITAAQMWDVVTEQRAIADVVAEYILATRQRALRMLSTVLELLAKCTSAQMLLEQSSATQSLSSLLSVADMVRYKCKKCKSR